MSLPPLRHPVWLMVVTIAFVGASITTFMAGAYWASNVLIVMAAFMAVMSRRAIRDWPDNRM